MKSTERAALQAALDHAAHFIPTQPPLDTFVHHNPLHALEEKPFDAAVIEASEIFGTQPYLEETRYRDELARGRITEADVIAVLDAELGPADREPLAPGLPSRAELRRLRLLLATVHARGEAVAFRISETDALHRIGPTVPDASRERLLEWAGGEADAEHRVLSRSWETCFALATATQWKRERAKRIRPRDALLAATGVDADELVHFLLIRLTAAFMDQGIAYWPMPERERGFFAAFRALYASGAGPDPWLASLEKLISEDAGDPAESVVRSLGALGVRRAEWSDFVTETLLALRGFAGMMRQLEERPDRAPVHAPPATLVDFLAVRLLLERAALAHLVDQLGLGISLPDIRRLVGKAYEPRVPERAFEAWQVASLAGITPDELEGDAGVAFMAEVDAFGGIERRRLLHSAYERQFVHTFLDAFAAHQANLSPSPATPLAQVITCIDEREESFRRALEEAAPSIETASAAGFYGVAMDFKGIDDAHPRSLCPVVIRPKHFVREVPSVPADTRKRIRKLTGQLAHQVDLGSRTFVRGSLVTASLGLAMAVPLVLRTLFPRTAARLGRGAAKIGTPRPPTQLELTRTGDETDAQGRLVGYTVSEQADIVGGLLLGTGLLPRLARLVVVTGHGSSSLNNPHESAHDCGACGGGRGGPNARAFSIMANAKEVRDLLASRGTPIPNETVFVGAYHDTCNDAVEYFDLDLVPATHAAELATVAAALDEARARDAHERSRRFVHAPSSKWIGPALRHVEARAEDLAQPRPEYGHATNAIALVGRRELTRGMYLDRRAFLVSYDPRLDPDGRVLERILAAVVPVGAGIDLEYWFSYVDPTGYGCGTKLPHNITSLLGVMNGHASDLRTGLPWQMVEIHEPVRLLTIIEAETSTLLEIAGRNAEIARLVTNHWVHLVSHSPTTGELQIFGDGAFVPYTPTKVVLQRAPTSIAYYGGLRDHLPWAVIGERPMEHAS